MVPPRILACALALALLAGASAALAEMYKYTDSKGRLHFTQDIGQVPPEYRDQVERKVLKREISVTGHGGQQTQDQRAVMEKRRRQLDQQKARVLRRARPARPPARARGNALTGSPEPQKYRRDCSSYTTNHRCRKIVTGAWRAWDAANGGDNGKPVTRRRIGK